MSTAFQAPPHQPTSIPSLNTPSPLGPASPSNRHYPSSHSSPARDANQQHAPGPSPQSASSRRPSRRPSAQDPPTGLESSMSSRAAVASPVPVPSPEQYSPASTSDRRRNNMPAAVPPRTSSTHHNGNAGPAGSRRAAQTGERPTNSPRRAHPEYTTNGTVDTTAQDEAQNSRSRRPNQMPQDPPHRTSSTRERREGEAATTMPIRSQTAASASKGPSRETSEILNSILISQPEVDIEREKERLALAQPHNVGGAYQDDDDDDAAPPPIVATGQGNGEEARRGTRSRHDHSKREKHTKFGEYILGNTIGEGEFGKVKLGWKQDAGVQVAIKLIKKDQLGSNPSRMAKILREVAILRQLTHPNIVRLHKMEESERHYGIVLEYASGGELFDYILNHRYLKDNAARRLFAQLVSGVGYLHKKGIVHRDLKLENLLLDRNRNIIITDFGFANTFDPNEELTEEEELNLSDREFVKRLGLDKVKANGSRKGDLMQTSCGSPCYAAPELVVSDSLYTGRKVDVWSCGVILYAMLAGYLPFDDDPANPEGDNINLLYKYIVNTPLTFPEYVTPHARDLLRRILVPNPRKRADLFEVARHSWLSEYAHVVEFITSSTTTPGEIQNTTVPAEDEGENPVIARSASVREASKKTAASPAIGGLQSKQGTIDSETEAAILKQQRDNKRRTVQVEYVAPNTTTQRGDASGTQTSGSGKTRARSGSQGGVELVDNGPSTSPKDKPLPKDPPLGRDVLGKTGSSRRPPSSHRNPATRQGRDGRAVSDAAYLGSVGGVSSGRPATGGSMHSIGAGGRSSYAQPVPPELADTNVHGRIQQPPKSANNYGMPSSAPNEQQNLDYGRPSISVPPKFAKMSGFAGEGDAPQQPSAAEVKGHRRSNTMGEIGGKLFGRSGSLFGGKSRKRQEQQLAEKAARKYPPVSMNNSMPAGDEPRMSMDSKRSRRSFSMGLGKKRSGSMTGSQTSQEKHTRRFSFIPSSISKAIGLGGTKDDDNTLPPDSQQDLPIQEPPALDQYGRYIDQNVGREHAEASTLDGMYAQLRDSNQQPDPYSSGQSKHAQYQHNQQYGRPSGGYDGQYSNHGAVLNTGSDASFDVPQQRRATGSAGQHHPQQHDPAAYDGRRNPGGTSKANRGVLQKPKRFVDAWDTDPYNNNNNSNNNSRSHDHSGSSGPARKVMDFFRRRGKARAGEGS